MSSHDIPSTAALRNKAFLLLLGAVSLAFAGILWPFFGAVFWGMVLAIVFTPLCRWFLPRVGRSRNRASLATLAVVLVLVVLPLTFLTLAVIDEAAGLAERLRSGQIDLGHQFEQLTKALPHPLQRLLDGAGLADFAALTRRAAAAASQGGRLLAARALDIGQNTLDMAVSFFLALYLAFFLLRDGGDLAARIFDAIPIHARHKRRLFDTFGTVVRATVKGNILVAAAQGALGGLAFWVLGVHAPVVWAVVMGFLSLLPAIGAGLIWVPVAVYFLATGEAVKGIGLVAYGVLVIGLVDNVLRPILVGKEIRMPDYLVLLTTIGGMAIFGINGFVIGPLVAAMFIAVWRIVLTEQQTAV